MTSVWRAWPATDSPAARPNARCYERFTYANAGLNGRGDAWLLDCPVLSEIDEDGDGAFERVRRYLQNARGDVVGVEESNPWYDREAVRYSVFGFPEVFQNEDPYHTADFNGDGNPGTDADITAFFSVLAGTPCSTCGSADTNRDGAVGTDDDITAFFDAIAGTGPATYPVSLSDNRFGFRGYWWDDHLKLYHVRHRVYDPASFRWLQPDPAGYVDGLNLYAYCGADPINLMDPYGLYGLKDWIRDSYNAFTGHVTNNMIDRTSGVAKAVGKGAVAIGAGVVIVVTFPATGPALVVVGSLATGYFGARAIDEAYTGDEKDLLGHPTGRKLSEEDRWEAGTSAAIGFVTVVATPFIPGASAEEMASAAAEAADAAETAQAAEGAANTGQGTSGAAPQSDPAAPAADTAPSELDPGSPASAPSGDGEPPSCTAKCFAAGTPVSCPGGDVDIENLQIGDRVYAFDLQSGSQVESQVTGIYRNFTFHWVEIGLGDEVIRATRSHLFWRPDIGMWIRAADLQPGMCLLMNSGSAKTVQSVCVQDLDDPEATYNLEVANVHTYFVGGSHVLVHNGITFIVTPGGTVFPVPPGASGPVPVFNNAGKQTGIAWIGGRGGPKGQVQVLRLMDPTPAKGPVPAYPKGYVTYENKSGKGGQAVDPYTGKTLPKTGAHFPCD